MRTFKGTRVNRVIQLIIPFNESGSGASSSFPLKMKLTGASGRKTRHIHTQYQPCDANNSSPRAKR